MRCATPGCVGCLTGKNYFDAATPIQGSATVARRTASGDFAGSGSKAGFAPSTFARAGRANEAAARTMDKFRKRYCMRTVSPALWMRRSRRASHE